MKSNKLKKRQIKMKTKKQKMNGLNKYKILINNTLYLSLKNLNKNQNTKSIQKEQKNEKNNKKLNMKVWMKIQKS